MAWPVWLHCVQMVLIVVATCTSTGSFYLYETISHVPNGRAREDQVQRAYMLCFAGLIFFAVIAALNWTNLAETLLEAFDY